MTDFSVVSTGHQGEKRSWLQALPGPDDVDSISLDISKFTQATHFPDGHIPSGVVLGVVSASSSGSKIVCGPYDDTASDGRQVAAYVLFNSARVVRPDGSKSTRLLAAGLARGTVADGKLPLTGVPGALDANGKADLKFIRFVAAA